MNLDPQQQAAVTTQSSRALVVAGAGSGKTRVLTERIAHLIEHEHASPYETLCWTFTRKAAGEMRERLEKRIGKIARHITMGTMHAVALQMLRRFGEIIGFRPDNITVYGAWEEDHLLKQVAAEIGVLKKSWKVPKKAVDRAFSDYYERGIEPGEQDPCRPLFDAFLARCCANNALTYSGLLLALRALIPTLVKHLRVKYILVDECQDLDTLQWSIINGMCEAFGASLFAVGDADQSIYSFRGAVPEYLLVHQHDFDIYQLETNYRSCPEIVEASNNLIRHNTARIDKTMVAARESTGKAIYVEHDHDSVAIADSICAWGFNDQVQVAVLSRIHALLKKLSDELTARGIPHAYVGRKSALTNSEEFRRLHAFLKLIINPFDNMSFLLIKGFLGLDATEYALVRVKAATQGMSHFHAWRVFGSIWTDFFSRALGREPVGVLIELEDLLIENSQWSPGFADAQHFAIEWFQANPKGTIKQYLDWLATYDLQDDLSDEQGEGLVLSTIHGAKGLEWHSVFIIGANEGIIPSKQAIAAGEIEEERRLMYVAMTRARDHLVVAVHPEYTTKDDRIFESPRSRFVGEMEGCL